MRTLRHFHFLLGLALAAIPASATITYCSSGCTNAGSNYGSMPSSNGNGALTYTSGAAFASVNLGGSPAVYTDPTTGVLFYGFSGTSGDNLSVSGSNLTQSLGGTGTSIAAVLPANTYAIAMVIGASSFADPFIELVSSPSSLNTGSNDLLQVLIANSSSPQFFGIVSDTPIASVFIWNGIPGGTLNVQSFEVGGATDGGGGGGATPEPSTVFLISGGFAGLYLLRRRRPA